MDHVLIAVDYNNLTQFRNWANERRLGLELQAFADPEVLASDWQGVLADHKRLLAGFKGPIGLHGAFYDMISASLDPAIVAVTRERYRQSLQAAGELGARYVVFHVNYMGLLKLANYRPGWHRRQVDFWADFMDEATEYDLKVVLENLWEDDPALITDIVDEVNHPNLKVCLDVAHATLFSPLPVNRWVETFSPHLFLCHLNNNDGELDLHWSLDKGVIPYRPILERLRWVPFPPLLTLEMRSLARLEASLPFFDLE